MWRADSLGKTLILGKIEGRRRRGWQRMRLLDSITDSMDRSSEGQGSLAFTRDRDRPAFERLSVSCGGTCQQWNLFQKDLYQYAITSQDFFSQYPWPRLGHCGLRPPPETTNTHRQVCLSLLWGHCSFLLDPGVLKALFVPSKTLFPQSCGSSIIKSYWPSKSNFPVGSLSLFQILRLWNLLVGPRTFVTQQELLWNNCPPVCGSPARRLYSGANVNLLQEEESQLHLSGPLLPGPLGLQQATADTCLRRRHSDTQRQVCLSLLWRSLLFSLDPGAHKVLFVPSEYLWQVWALI